MTRRPLALALACSTLLATPLASRALAQDAPPASEMHELAPTRMLRRAYLMLLQRAPTVDEYQEILSLPEPERMGAVRDAIGHALRTDAFQRTLMDWGHEYLRVQSFNYRKGGGPYFTGTHAADLDQCPEGSLWEGTYGLLNGYPRYGDPHEICNDAAAPMHEVEPWWAPGTTITVIGSAGTGVREVDGNDCGRIGTGVYAITRNHEDCSCGPHMLYCGRRNAQRFSPRGWEGDNHDPTSIRRAAFEEPARLFAHIVAGERPFSDLVLGNYTVVNPGLRFFYYRVARHNSDNAFLDDSTWWRDHQDPLDWREVPLSELHPNLLDDDDYHFDPRVDGGSPAGIPAAGVLTTMGANATFPRERVRAARWMETFACREFTPPPADVSFNPYERDPMFEGTCQHCHKVIDPVAIHFKRMFGPGLFLAGVGRWSLEHMNPRYGTRARFEAAFLHDTFLTPVSEAALAEATDRRLVDFLPPDATLFGQTSDGTVGPRGFAKMLVESGVFDRCAVRRIYDRFAPGQLVPGRDDRAIAELASEFVDNGRNALALIESILAREELTRGW